MDVFIIVIDVIVILIYTLLIALISPYLIGFIKNRNYDLFFQLIPVLSFIFISSIIIAISYGGFKETLFFRLTSIFSFILLLCLLLLTLLMKKLWKEEYEKLVTRVSSIPKLKGVIFQKAK